jgi:hypothetical protein
VDVREGGRERESGKEGMRKREKAETAKVEDWN